MIEIKPELAEFVGIFDGELPQVRHLRVGHVDLGFNALIVAPLVRPKFYWATESLCQYRATVRFYSDGAQSGFYEFRMITPSDYLAIYNMAMDGEFDLLRDYLLSLPEQPSQAAVDKENERAKRSYISQADISAMFKGESKPKAKPKAKPKTKAKVKNKTAIDQLDLFGAIA